MSNITIIGIDLAKNVFQVCGLNKAFKVQFNKLVKRNQLVEEVLRHPGEKLAMEACGSSHHWARLFGEMGYDVKLIPAQHVKQLSRGNKSDANDALAIAESMIRPNLHKVQFKSLKQQDLQTLLRIRTRYLETRTAVINQTRGVLSEYGIILPRSVADFRRYIPDILEDAENELTVIAREALNALYEESIILTEKIAAADEHIKTIASQHSTMSDLMKLRGIGPITAVALYACIGNGHHFNNARQLAAWIGLVPKQYGTGGKMVLGSISKRGDRYVRLLMIHGARTVMNWMKDKINPLSLWAKQLIQRRGKHKAIVAIANKTARMIWVLLNKGLDALPKHYLSAA